MFSYLDSNNFCPSETTYKRNFKRNRELWVEKLTKTIERDKKVNMELTKMGWKIYTS